MTSNRQSQIIPANADGYQPLSWTPAPASRRSSVRLSFSHAKPVELGRKEEIYQMLLNLCDEDLSWIMCNVMTIRPSLEVLLEDHKNNLRKTVAAEEPSEDMKRECSQGTNPADQLQDAPILQFMAPTVYVCEDEPSVEVRVLRVGGSNSHSEVRYTTRDASAFAGKAYKSSEGLLVFEEGDVMKTISVDLIPDSGWKPGRQFGVALMSEDLVNAKLEKYLRDTTVVLVEDNPFPTMKYKDFIWRDELETVPNIGLVVEYIKMQWRNEHIRCAMMKIILSDFFYNVLFLARALLQMYLVDCVLNVEVPGSSLFIAHERNYTLACVAAAVVAPQVLVHYLESLKPFGLTSQSLKLLQKSLFDRYLKYSPAAAVEEDILLAMSRDSVDVVQHICHGTLRLLALLGRIAMICIIQFVAPLIFKQSIRWMTVIPLCVLPLLMFAFLAARDWISTRVISERLKTSSAFIEFVEEVVQSQSLVTECCARDVFIELCEAKITAHHSAIKEAHHVMVNNKQLAEWLSILLLACYTLTGGLAVLDGQVTIGRFVTNLNIFAGMGTVYSNIYSHLLKIQEFTPGLKRLTHLMNVPTEWSMRADMCQHCHDQSDQLFASFASQDQQDVPLIDQLPICIGGVTFRYETDTLSHDLHSYCMISKLDYKQDGLNFHGHLRISQGQLVQLIGPHHEGKTTLLKLIAGILMPRVSEDLLHSENPFFFVPPHLRSAYVPTEPVFLRASLLENLTLGVKGCGSDGSIARVSKICGQLGLSDSIVSFLEGDCVHSWAQHTSHTEKKLLSLARAFVANPQLLCVERPWTVFDHQTSLRILQLLRTHVDQRGIEQDHHHRGPRTCILTGSDNMFVTGFIDCTFSICKAKGIELVREQSERYRGA